MTRNIQAEFNPIVYTLYVDRKGMENGPRLATVKPRLHFGSKDRQIGNNTLKIRIKRHLLHRVDLRRK